MYSIVDMEITRFFEEEEIEVSDTQTVIAHIVDLFFKIIGIKQYTDIEQLMYDIRDNIKIPLITAKEYAKVHNLTNDRLILKAVDSMQTRIKEYISKAPDCVE